MSVVTDAFRDGIRVATTTAIAGTVFIAAAAFWLSFTSLSDLALRSGIEAAQAWAWPLIVDGIIVVATVAAVVLARSRVAWYPWTLLFLGAAVSVLANSIHAIIAAHVDVPPALAAAVAAVPPLVLLAITHLTSILMRHPAATPTRHDDTQELSAADDPAVAQRDLAWTLHSAGWPNAAIARRLGVHRSTVGRWLSTAGDLRPALEQGGKEHG